MNMSHRERMLAAIRGAPSDQIPWAPRMDLWYIANRALGTLPEEFRGLNLVEIAEVMETACHANGADYTLPGARDLTLRGLGCDYHQDYPYRVELRRLPVTFDDDGENLRTRIKAPAGEIVTHLQITSQMTQRGISLPFVKSYAIDTPTDFEAVAQVFEHLEVVPTPEGYTAFKRRMGDSGIAVARGPVAASPMHWIMHELIATEQFFYLYVDKYEALRQLATRMEPFFDSVLDALVLSQSEIDG